MKTIKSFEQKGWSLKLNETKENKFQVTLERDNVTADKSSEVTDCNVGLTIFDKFLDDLTKRVINKGDF